MTDMGLNHSMKPLNLAKYDYSLLDNVSCLGRAFHLEHFGL